MSKAVVESGASGRVFLDFCCGICLVDDADAKGLKGGGVTRRRQWAELVTTKVGDTGTQV